MSSKYFVIILCLIVQLGATAQGVLEKSWEENLIRPSEFRAGFYTDAQLKSTGEVVLCGQFTALTRSLVKLKCYDNSGTLSWERELPGPEYLTARPVALRIDGSDNIYLLCDIAKRDGEYMLLAKYDASGTLLWEEVQFTGGYEMVDMELTSSGEPILLNSSFLQKFDANGNELWQEFLTNDFPNDMTLDGQGNILITGAEYIFSSAVWVAKFGSDGSSIWNKYHDVQAGEDEEGLRIIVDGNDDCFITGWADDPNDEQMMIAKVDKNGSLIWSDVSSGSEEIHGTDIIHDGQAIFTFASPASGYDDSCKVFKYDLNGNKVWVRILPGKVRESGRMIQLANGTLALGIITDNSTINYAVWTITPSGSTAVTDIYTDNNAYKQVRALLFQGSDLYLAGGGIKYSNINGEATLLKVSATPALDWVEKDSGAGKSEYNGQVMTGDSDGNLITVDRYLDTFFVEKYNGAGQQLWSEKFVHTYTDNRVATHMLTDDQDDIYVFVQAVDGVIQSYSVDVYKYSSGGSQLWHKVYNEYSEQLVHDVALMDNGNIAICGDGNLKMFVSAMDASTGNVVWEYDSMFSSYVTAARKLYPDGSGNLIVAAETAYGQQLGDLHYFKLNATGQLQWFHSASLSNSPQNKESFSFFTPMGNDEYALGGRQKQPFGGSIFMLIWFDGSGNETYVDTLISLLDFKIGLAMPNGQLIMPEVTSGDLVLYKTDVSQNKSSVTVSGDFYPFGWGSGTTFYGAYLLPGDRIVLTGAENSTGFRPIILVTNDQGDSLYFDNWKTPDLLSSIQMPDRNIVIYMEEDLDAQIGILARYNAEPTGISGATSANRVIRVFPNPAADQLSFEWVADHSSDITCTLTDLLGRPVHDFQHTEQVIPGKQVIKFQLPAKLLSGPYVLSVKSGDEVYPARVMIVR